MTDTTKNLKPFRKGDPRINRKGRPKSFDALRELSQMIANEKAHDKNGDPVIYNGHSLTIAETIMRQWAGSKNPILQRAFIEICYGKVPDKVDVNLGGSLTWKSFVEGVDADENSSPE